MPPPPNATSDPNPIPASTPAPAPSPSPAPPAVRTTNRRPVVSNWPQNLTVVAGRSFTYDVSQGGTAITDPDGDDLTYWLEFASAGVSGSGAQLFGTPPAPTGFVVFVWVRDNYGALTAADTIPSFGVTVVPNAAPQVTRRNQPLITTRDAYIYYDLTQGGSTFTDPNGDSLTYEVSALSPQHGLSVHGTSVAGTLSAVAAVSFRITATDGYGGSGTDVLTIALPGPEPAKPALPTVSYVYDDAKLPLPFLFALSRASFSPFWDTTPDDNPTTDAGATLGRVLFYDKRLSITNTHACASCHHQGHGFAAPERFSSGVLNVPLQRNSLGLTNVRHNLDNLYFIDQRTESLERLVLMPIEEPTELGHSIAMLEQKLAATDFYAPLFEAAFGTPDVTPERIARALAQFLRSLLSFRSKFDRAYHVMNPGDPTIPETIFTLEEQRGKEVFERTPGPHCAACHRGGVQLLDQPTTNGLDAQPADPGSQRGFRAASLRNIAVTAPYMHDGRFATLREVIDHYDHGVQKTTHSVFASPLFDSAGEPRRFNLSEEDKDALEAFLNTLTDDAFLTDPRFADPFP